MGCDAGLSFRHRQPHIDPDRRGSLTLAMFSAGHGDLMKTDPLQPSIAALPDSPRTCQT